MHTPFGLARNGVIWTLEELQLDYTLMRLDAAKGDLQAPEFVRLNPAGKIPVLIHGDRVLTESLPIADISCARCGPMLAVTGDARREVPSFAASSTSR